MSEPGHDDERPRVSRDEASVLMEASLDDSLSDAQRLRLEGLLQADPSLREELEQLRALRRAASELSRDAPRVDVLAGVQSKLRARSGGRFYRDQFAQSRGRRSGLTWFLSASVLLLTLCLLWLILGAGLLDR